MKKLIRGAMVADGQQIRRADVMIDGSTIIRIGDEIAVEPTDEIEEVDASGKYLLPGIIDDQVHFRSPGLEHKEDLEHATRACAKGGVTTFLEMPNTHPTTTTCERLDEKLEMASKRCLVNYGFYIGATPDNLIELQNAKRTPGIKIFIGSSTGDLLVDKQAALEKIFGETELPICAHCEDEATVRANADKYSASTNVRDHSRIRNEHAAVIATKRAIDLAHRHNHPFHVLHVSTAAEVPLIRDAGELITAEVCPHHLFFNVDDYERLGSLIKMNPSVKNKSDNEALWQALLDGDIEVIATDHAPHTLEEKALPFPDCPSGLPAVENSLALMLDSVNSNRMSLELVVRAMCENPARIWNIKNKGRIAAGFDADLVLVDMNLVDTISNEEQQTKNRWSPWDGTQLQGWPVTTWVMGQEVFSRDQRGDATFANWPAGEEIQFER